MSKEKNLDGFDGFAQVDADNFNWDFGAGDESSPEVIQEALEQTTVETKEEDETVIAEKKAEEKIWAELEESTETSTEKIEEEEEDTTNTSPQNKDTKKSSAIITYEFLKEKGFITEDLPEGEVLTDEKAIELSEAAWEVSLEAEVEATIKDLPAEAQGLLKIAASGGNVNEYLRTLVKNVATPINKETDMTVEANQILAVTMDLQRQDYDAEYIETHITGLKDSGKLQEQADKVAAKMIKEQDKEATEQVEKVKAAKTARTEATKVQKEGIATTLTTIENIKGVVINKKDKEILPEYMAVPSVELQDGRVITKMQEELFKAMADPQKAILIAKLLKNDFDFSSITAASMTQYTDKIKANLTNSKQGNGKDQLRTGSPHKVKKSLADMLGD